MAKRLEIKPGTKYGKLTVIEHVGYSKNKHRLFKCICDCGNETKTSIGNLRSGLARSCGCARSKHGQYKTSAYKVWSDMKTRCFNKKNKRFKDYGGRGITVCERWLKFENFLKDMGPPKKGYSIERLDNNSDYTPTNCIWATSKQQGNNRRTNVCIEFDGDKLTISEASRKYKLNRQTLASRLKNNWPLEKALGLK